MTPDYQDRPRHARSGLFLFLLLLLWGGAYLPAHAQILVSLQIKRGIYMLHEPIIATVTLTNNTGRDIMLDDTKEGGQWFSFQITDTQNRVVDPRNPNYELPPLPVPAGETVKRSVNLNQLYALDNYGVYKVRASIYFPPMGKFFSSKYYPLQVTEGKVIWKQSVGMPDAENSYRNFTLLTMEHDKGKSIYIRIEGQEDGTTYGCYELGPQVADFQPETVFDRGNNLWVLQLVGQKTYVLSRIGINGDFEGQSTYVTPKNIPRLRKLADGTLQIVGAYKQDRVAANKPEDIPKLSDRPAGLPK
jgi:hypothetical protein